MNLIPLRQERDKVYEKITAIGNIKLQKQAEQPQKEKERKLTPLQLNELIKRLKKNTGKYYHMQKKIDQIQQLNTGLKKIRQKGQRVQNRLLEKGKQMSLRKQQIAKEHEERVKKQIMKCRPEISQMAKDINQEPIRWRVNQIITDQQKHKLQLESKYMPTFTPKVDSHTEFINSIANGGQNVFLRMKKNQLKALERKDKLICTLKKQEQQAVSFEPQLNITSKIISSMKRRSSCQQKSTHLQCKQIKESSDDHIPAINPNSVLLMHNKNANFQQRLKEHSKLQEQRKKQMQNMAKNSQNHQPRLNKKSLKIANQLRASKQHGIEEDVFEIIDDSLFGKQNENPNCQRGGKIKSQKTNSSHTTSISFN